MTVEEYYERVLDDVLRYRADCEFVNEYEEAECRQCNENVFGSIERMLKKHLRPSWVTEYLPENDGEYFVTWTTSATEKHLVGVCEYSEGEGWILEPYMQAYPDVRIKAWMEMPKPYRENVDEQTTTEEEI